MRRAPIVFISGWAHGEEALRPLAEAMAASGRIVSNLSLASCGPFEDGDKNISAYGRFVSSHLDTSGEPATIVGWSTGGVVALETAARYPEKVDRLVLLSTTARFCSDKDYTSGVNPAVLRAMIRGLRKNPEDVVSDFIREAMHPLDIGAEVLAARTQSALAAGTVSLAHGLKYLLAADLRRDLPSLALPCLIVHGLQDRIVPVEAGRYLTANLPDSEIVMSSAGHCLPEQCEEGLIRRIGQFLERL
ncbi:MAG: alpha/beta hydrolase [Syntrophobacteraceae bacterium]|nr:alpha/beta hydrolase [Syntrophobacteraceae bacterium]